MSSRQNIPKPIRRLILSFQALFRVLIQGAKQVAVWYLRRRRELLTRAGFVLPTTIMVLLIVGLFTGALIVRTGERSEDVIRSREAQRIDSIAAPAVERAKAKLEHIFNRDPRFPVGVPSKITLRDMMRYDENLYALIPDGSGGNAPDPYLLPDETRLDLNEDGVMDNAWSYTTDLDGDGTSETIAYSILMTPGIDDNGDGDYDDVDDVGFWSSNEEKAENLVTRTGPLSIEATAGNAADCDIEGLANENGWFAADATSVRTNFQVNVFVQNENDANRTVTALEFQQDRQLDRGNKFGVWFRYDLLIHPGPQFNLNGAIHTDGNLITWNNTLQFYLVSSPDSCVFTEDANTITLTQEEAPDGTITYQAQAISANGSTEEVDLFADNANNISTVDFSPSTDAIDANVNNTSLYNYTLDPLILFTRDVLAARNQVDNNGNISDYDVTLRDANWATHDPSERIRNDIQRKPYVDDLYRADDRWGPKPRYGPDAALTIEDLPNGADENGDLIEDSDAPDLNAETLIGLDPPDEFPKEVGLDGYWERRAYVQGLRVIVGQRLEVGNPFGWIIDRDDNGDYTDTGDKVRGDDPMNPAEGGFIPPSDMDNEDSNIYRQQRTLRDNLASVQATAVYHHNNSVGEGDFPVATIATTAHPGTMTTIANSTTFNNNADTGALETNFLQGRGTNGWEFQPPGSTATTTVDTDAAFAALMNDPATPLRKALTNLGYMSGDPDGAFPPVQEAAGGVVHPYPQLTMWGDYSNLRRAVDQLPPTPPISASDPSYTDLSLADRTTLQTAAATLGMLAYNLDYLEGVKDSLVGNGNSGELVSLGQHLQSLVDNTFANGNPEIGRDDATGQVVLCFNNTEGYFDSGGTPDERTLVEDHCSPSVADPDLYDPNYYSSFSLEEWRQALQLWGGLRSGSNVPSQGDIDNLDFITFYNQVMADREFGFSTERVLTVDTSGSDYSGTYDPATGTFTISVNHGGVDAGTEYTIPNCDPNIFGLNPEQPEVGLALAACQTQEIGAPKYPALYYLFPVNDHWHDGTNNGNPGDRQPNEDYNGDGSISTVTEQDFNSNGAVDAVEDLNGNGTNTDTLSEDLNGNGVLDFEPYISDPYIFARDFDDPTTGTGVNFGLTYEAVNPVDIALPPRPRSSWVLPHTTTQPETPDANPNVTDLTRAAQNPITDNGTPVYVPFLDKGMFNGRQLMMARVLNIDLGILRDNTGGTLTPSDGAVYYNIINDNLNGESWLPNSGLFYAFREDAVREDGIARPRGASTAWDDCNTEGELVDNISSTCTMDPTVPRDPPKRDANGVSPKPVDFVADPDRRPNGFRLSNGWRLGRVGTNRGLSFITDNPAYILGEFNLHSKEEFTTALNIGNYSNFYSRSNLESNFAKGDADNPNHPDFDAWRPTEVLADAITTLSNNYCDGTIEAGIRDTNDNNVAGGCEGNNHSFRNTMFNGDNSSNWILEDSSTSPTGNNASAVPVLVGRNGEIATTGGLHNTYLEINDDRSLNDATDTTMNLVFISGLSPTRAEETYGGLHNFPRFNERWRNDDLRISGSLIQLNFSTYDAANLDQQNTFYPAASAASGNEFNFYKAPNRRWGYDVALQYNPPGPIVERLLSQSGLRSEIYQEIDVSDPYSQQLCRAVTTDSPTCPDP